MPKNFRTCQGPFIERPTKTGYDATYVPSRQGLDGLKISTSADFSEKGFTNLIAEIRKLHNGPITIVDLRSESHGLLNGIHTPPYDLQNWSNIGLNVDEVMKKEHQEMYAMIGTVVELTDISSDNGFVPINPMPITVEKVQTEKELCEANDIGYVRFPILDHTFPDDRDLEHFISFVESLPSNIWLHFHCKAGKGRATSFMVFYDMMHNLNVSLKVIVYRQTNIGGEYPLYTGCDPDVQPWKVPLSEEKTEMIPLFY